MTPLSVDEAIEAAIRRHPWYANRTQVLHQWFCVPGNGMKWECGAIVPKAPEERDETPEQWLWRHHLASVYERMKDAMPDRYEQELRSYEAECAMLRDHQERAAELARTPGEVEHLEEYSHGRSMLLNEIPEDVRPDWAAAAQEITGYLNDNSPVGKKTDE